eukprot:Transcript_21042.p1 GENE.Transcript_21042~~Transcript_21042.p1  ORF type:complete len:807 (+),score=158.02 Transcript_21042:127-2421(+)
MSVPQILVLGVLALMGANYYMRISSSSQRYPASKPGAPEDATTRNLALARLHNQLKERDATIGELEAKLEEAQHSHRATLEAQPPKPEVPRPPEPAKKPPELKAVPSVAEPAESTAASTAVVVAAGGAASGELVDVPPDTVFPDKLRKCTKGSDLFISFSSGSMAAFALNWVANLRKTGITQILVGALDDKMLSIAEEEGVPSMPLDGSSIKNRGAANLRFDYSAYKRMAALKVAFYTRILTMGFNIWACDADTGWMGDPSVFIQEYPMQHVDMLTTTDCIDLEGDQKGGCWHVDHNTGLVYMRSRPAVLEFTAAWKKKIETTRDIMVRDQAALNLLMRENFRSKTWAPPPDVSPSWRLERRAGRGKRVALRLTQCAPRVRTAQGHAARAQHLPRVEREAQARAAAAQVLRQRPLLLRAAHVRQAGVAAPVCGAHDVPVRRLVQVPLRQAAADARGARVAGRPALVLHRRQVPRGRARGGGAAHRLPAQDVHHRRGGRALQQGGGAPAPRAARRPRARDRAQPHARAAAHALLLRQHLEGDEALPRRRRLRHDAALRLPRRPHHQPRRLVRRLAADRLPRAGLPLRPAAAARAGLVVDARPDPPDDRQRGAHRARAVRVEPRARARQRQGDLLRLRAARPAEPVAEPRTQARAVQPPLLPGGRDARLVRRAAPRLRPLLRAVLPRRARPPLPLQVPCAGARVPGRRQQPAPLLQGPAQRGGRDLAQRAPRRLPGHQSKPAQPALPRVRGQIQSEVNVRCQYWGV